MLRQIEQIPYAMVLIKRLRRNSYFKQVCGYGSWAPYEAHVT
jgi:hypothetical protein